MHLRKKEIDQKIPAIGPAMGKMAALLASHTWAVGWWLSFYNYVNNTYK